MLYLFLKSRYVRTATVRILFLIFLLPTCLFSQYDDLIKDEDISWIAEFEMELNFAANENAQDSDNWLTQEICKNLLNGKFPCFRTSALEKPYSIEEINKKVNSPDTIIGFPEYYGEELIIIKNDLFESKTCLTKQAIYYNKNTGVIGTYLIAVAPMISAERRNTNFKRPFAWVEMDVVLDGNISEESNKVALSLSEGTKATMLELGKLKIVKGELDFNQYLYETAKNGNFKVKDGQIGFGSNKYLTEEDIDSIYMTAFDSIDIFTTTAKNQESDVIQNGIKLSHLVQDWYYLPKKGLIANRLKAIAPVIEVTDNTGELKKYKPLYYIGF